MDKKKPLIIRDEIHGDMTFNEPLKRVINHSCFQRLRYIKQAGLAEFVFPCATHTRFQHSLGASFLAGQYFETMLRGWLSSPLDFDGRSENTRFFGPRTREVLTRVAEHPASLDFWQQTAMLAALLHDVGHGPWSHTFEALELKQDFSSITKKMPGVLGKYFADLEKKKTRLKHEDLSVIYIFKILGDLEDLDYIENARRYVLAVASLANRRVGGGTLRHEVEGELTGVLQEGGIRGGVEVHRLLRPIISGPFDVDRIDYIQRDGRNCGVNIGGIEWRRIVTKLIPCLAEHKSRGEQPEEVVLVSNMKNQHVLDDFIFSLFQMYAQVYMHPKIVALEEVTRRLVKKRAKTVKGPVVDFELHASLTDDGFRKMLNDDFKIPEIEDILFRRPRGVIHVVNSGPGGKQDRDLKKAGYLSVTMDDRAMMKDSVGVFLFTSMITDKRGDESRSFIVSPWEKVSPLAQYFFNVNYSPKIWIKSEVL